MLKMRDDAILRDFEHVVVNDTAGRNFVLFFNGELSEEKVGPEDIIPVAINFGSPFASAAWSCGCDWYFIVTTEGILLLSVFTHRGFLCRKKSSAFIEMFLEAPRRNNKHRHKR